mmetsp:Transcript_25195/g.73984  ORF Transcript_25195/g.73984 Transcript_25195/m.73984 type:complete len:161 (+) Transcript_25195:4507-4989(+)
MRGRESPLGGDLRPPPPPPPVCACASGPLCIPFPPPCPHAPSSGATTPNESFIRVRSPFSPLPVAAWDIGVERGGHPIPLSPLSFPTEDDSDMCHSSGFRFRYLRFAPREVLAPSDSTEGTQAEGISMAAFRRWRDATGMLFIFSVHSEMIEGGGGLSHT